MEDGEGGGKRSSSDLTRLVQRLGVELAGKGGRTEGLCFCRTMAV